MVIKQGSAVRLPVVLTDAISGNPTTGVVFSAVTVWIQQQNGASYSKTIDNAHWFEIDSVNMQSLYDLLLDATDTVTVGFLKYVVTVTGCAPYYGIIEVREGTTGDIYNALLRALGMLHENSVLDVTTFDANNNLTAARLRIYNTRANTLAAKAASPGSYDTGKIAQYAITATYVGVNLTNYVVTRES